MRRPEEVGRGGLSAGAFTASGGSRSACASRRRILQHEHSDEWRRIASSCGAAKRQPRGSPGPASGVLAYNLDVSENEVDTTRGGDEAAAAADRPVISRPRSWPTSPRCARTVATGTGPRRRSSRSFAHSTSTSYATAAHELAAMPLSILLAAVARLMTLRPPGRPAGTGQARRRQPRWPLLCGPVVDGVCPNLAAGRCLLRAPRPNPCRPRADRRRQSWTLYPPWFLTEVARANTMTARCCCSNGQ